MRTRGKHALLGAVIVLAVAFGVAAPLHAQETQPSGAPAPASGKFVLTLTEGKVSLVANEAEVKEILAALANKAGVGLTYQSPGQPVAKSITLKNVSVEEAFRQISDSYLMEFTKASEDGEARLIAVHAVPSGAKGQSVGSKPDVSIPTAPSAAEPQTEPVPIALAEFVASDYLPKFRPGEWALTDRFTYYDLDGNAAVHVFVYRTPDADATNRDAVMEMIEGARTERDAAARRADTLRIPGDNAGNQAFQEAMNNRNAAQRAMYATEEFQTVMVGTTTTSKPLMRCYRGLPAPLVRRKGVADQLRAQHPAVAAQLSDVVYLGPFDLFYKAGDYLVSVKDGSLLKLDEMKKRLDAAAVAKTASMSRLTEQQRQTLAEQERLRDQHFLSQWSGYADKSSATDKKNVKEEQGR